MSCPLRLPEASAALEPLRVMILSRDPRVVTALTSLLEQAGPVEIAHERREANVVLWDVRAGENIGALEQSTAAALPTVALIEEESQVPALLGAGARGVVLRSHVGPSLIPALQAARVGLAVVDASLAPAILPETKPAPMPPDVDALTSRETQVLDLLTLGMSNKQIAAQLDISNHTAKFHVNSILQKLGAATRTEAVVTAVRFGLVTL